MDTDHDWKKQSEVSPLFGLDDKQYRSLRESLVHFFKVRASVAPEDNASETILRVLQSAARGVPIGDLRAYAHGIAKHLLQESRRQANRTLPPVLSQTSLPDQLSERCLSDCKRLRLSKDQRWLIRQYYAAGSGPKKIAQHRSLAASLCISAEALRLRVHRVRAKLTACVEECRQRLLTGKPRT
jgi:DNA-directed RNA polymerase specialized sigma24 family protein